MEVVSPPTLGTAEEKGSRRTEYLIRIISESRELIDRFELPTLFSDQYRPGTLLLDL